MYFYRIPRSFKEWWFCIMCLITFMLLWIVHDALVNV